MDTKVIFALIYPIWVVFTAVSAIFVTAYFLPDRKHSAKRVEHRVKK